MLVNALKAVGDAIEALTSIPDAERTEEVLRMIEDLREMHTELSARLSQGVQGEIFRDQFPLQEELPELGAFEIELEFVQTC